MWYRNNEVFNSQQAIRNDNKESSLPHFLSDSTIEELGYVKVAEVAKPEVTAVQTIQDGGVQLVDNVPTQVWNVVDMFADIAEYTNLEGVVIPAKAKTEYETEYLAGLQADAMNAMVQHFTDVTTQYIEGKVQTYNVTNGLAFKDIDAFTKYAINPLSQHHTIANQFIDYADKVWLAVRAYQATAAGIPTEIEFKTLLDSVVF